MTRGAQLTAIGARMTKALTLHLDDFGKDALDRFAGGRSDAHSATVRTASLYYLEDRDEDRPAWRVPRFARGNGSTGSDVVVRLDDDTWHALDDEAQRQGVSAESLARHALLYFLADVDSGRAGARLESAVAEDDESA
jgi:predicted transcriptional regulator